VELKLIFKALEQGATVLTANNRLSRYIATHYDQFQQLQGLKVWPSPTILPLETWLGQEFKALQAEHEQTLGQLSSAQQLLVWDEILTRESAAYPFLNTSATAQSLQSAWKIACAWQFEFEDFDGPLSEDQQQFIHWSAHYRNYCKERGVLDSAMLIDYLLAENRVSGLKLPRQIILCGFYELTPQQSMLFEVLRQSGVEVSSWSQKEETPANLGRLSPCDDKAELQMAAKWVRQNLENNPNAKLAVIVPDLAERKTELQYHFKQCFFPNLTPQQISDVDLPWSISLGTPLSQIPIAETANLLLKLSVMSLSSSEATQLLLSHFLIKGELEQEHRANLDTRQETRQMRQISLQKLIQLTQKNVKALHESLNKVGDLLVETKQFPSKWAHHLSATLELMGWPGERVLSSEEYQQAKAVKNAIFGLNELDSITGKVSAKRAFQLVSNSFSQGVFQLKAKDAPVQVLGLLEVTGMSFDAVWVCSMDNQRWPVTGVASPYLPLSWQRKVGAPHASPERELHYMRATLDQIKQSGKTVLFSHVAMRDENALQCAKIIEDIALLKAENLMPEVRQFVSAQLQTFDDQLAPKVQGAEHISGGSGLLAAQAACPFRSFVTYRLLVKDIDAPRLGIDPRDRGNFIHNLLEAFWDEVKEQKNLLAMDEDTLNSKVYVLAEKVMQGYDNLYRLSQLEKKRLIKIALQWLNMEKNRQKFIVEEVEQKREIIFEGFEISLMLDRVDRVFPDDGASCRVIIDYKSGGTHNPSAWMDERPDAPQLPLYAITNEDDVSAICYAMLSNTDQGFKGYASREDLLPGVALPISAKTVDEPKKTLSWEQAEQQWKEQLGALAQEVRAGVASVTPKAKACDWCHLSAVCRVNDQHGEQA
jgi:probable DNA repair protein